MSGWWDRIRQLWRTLWRRRSTAAPTAVEPIPESPAPLPPPPAPEPVPVLAPAPPAPAAPIATRLESKSAKLRSLERARRRHDKFVKPKGERPPKQERAPRAPKATVILSREEEPVTVGDYVDGRYDQDGRLLIADEWMEGDGQGDVLYREQEFYGEFNFRDSILDQLDRYWVYLGRMRKHDFGAYMLCSKLGATLVPYTTTFSNRLKRVDRKDEEERVKEFKSGIALPPWFKQHWPAFGCVAIGTNPLDEKAELRPRDSKGRRLWVVKFLYFQKFSKTPWYVQPVRGGHLYEMTIYWDRPHDRKYRRKWGVPQKYYIWISDDGNKMRALKTREKDPGQYTAPGDWRLEYELDEDDKERGLTPQLMLSRHFCDAAKLVEQASYAMCRVEVSKGELTATFGVDPRRMSYFFRDRDIKLTQAGVTKRIFHLVRPHKRADGTMVPMHFRGLRQFTWADYNVSITVPGRDHFMLPEWSVGAISIPKHDAKKNRDLDEREVAETLQRWIKTGVGGHHPTK